MAYIVTFNRSSDNFTSSTEVASLREVQELVSATLAENNVAERDAGQVTISTPAAAEAGFTFTVTRK